MRWMCLWLFLVFCFWATAADVPAQAVPGAVKWFAAGPINHVFALDRVVPLEFKEEAVVGAVWRVVLDPRNGDILVGDYRSSACVFRFDAEGRFKHRIGRSGQGPGEYEYMLNFAVGADGAVYVLSGSKLVKYNAAGVMQQEIRMRSFTNDIAVVGDQVVVRLVHRFDQDSDPALLVYDSDLNLQQGVGRRDARLDIKLYLPQRSLAVMGTTLIETDFYAPHLHSMDARRNLVTTVLAPESDDFAEVWDIRNKAQRDKAVNARVRFFVNVQATDRFVFLHEHQDATINNYWVYEPGTGSARVFVERPRHPGKPPVTIKNKLFGAVAGAYPDGFIATVDQSETLQDLALVFPELAKVTMAEDDNPVFIFLAVK